MYHWALLTSHCARGWGSAPCPPTPILPSCYSLGHRHAAQKLFPDGDAFTGLRAFVHAVPSPKIPSTHILTWQVTPLLQVPARVSPRPSPHRGS